MISETINSKIKAGATVRVWEKVPAETDAALSKKGAPRKKEGFHLSRFEGLVLARKHGNEIGASFTVRATVAGVGVEKSYPIHSPLIDKVDVLSSPKKIHRAKLYYVRELSRKETQQKLRFETMKLVKEVMAEKALTEPKENLSIDSFDSAQDKSGQTKGSR
jgi:ribosomal protein L19